MKKKSSLLFIVIVFLLAFLPVVSFVFALKNDFFLSYFPPRFLLSETLRNGQFPLWNPYISFGLPFYADMNGAYWNPLTWAIALTTGYSAYSLTVELLFYVLMGGFGMYKLAEHYTGNIYIRFIGGISFMCNGFIVGHLQHLNWISCSAFLPWCIWGVLKINKSADVSNILVTVLAFYFLISSSHPGMIIGAIYFFTGLILYLLIEQSKQEGIANFKNGIKKYSFFLLLLLLLCSGLIAGYSDILPYFDRSSKVDETLSLVENTTAQSWISLLLPFATTKNEALFNNDIAFRNNYFGLTLLCFFLTSFFSVRLKSSLIYLFSGLFFLLLSSGGPIKQFAHDFLPLIGYVRLNAEFRIFAIVSFIILAIQSFDHFILQKDQLLSRLVLLIKILLLTCGFVFLLSLLQILQGNSILYSDLFSNTKDFRNLTKIIIDSLRFFDVLVIQSGIQIILLLLLLNAFRKRSIQQVLLITAIDLIIATNLNIPFTGVGKASVATIHSIYQLSPPGIPTPVLQPLNQYDTINPYNRSLVGDWSFLNKKIGNAKPAVYPVKISSIYQYYNLLNEDSSVSIAGEPFIFISRDITSLPIMNSQLLTQEAIQTFGTNYIKLKFLSKDSGYLVFLQNYYPHWYYETGNKKAVVLKAGDTFMAAPVTKGENEVELYFKPSRIKLFFGLSTLLFFIYILYCSKSMYLYFKK